MPACCAPSGNSTPECARASSARYAQRSALSAGISVRRNRLPLSRLSAVMTTMSVLRMAESYSGKIIPAQDYRRTDNDGLEALQIQPLLSDRQDGEAP